MSEHALIKVGDVVRWDNEGKEYYPTVTAIDTTVGMVWLRWHKGYSTIESSRDPRLSVRRGASDLWQTVVSIP